MAFIVVAAVGTSTSAALSADTTSTPASSPRAAFIRPVNIRNADAADDSDGSNEYNAHPATAHAVSSTAVTGVTAALPRRLRAWTPRDSSSDKSVLTP